MDTDRNLLFGVLALQADLINPGQFVEACTLWTTQKKTSLADLLVERGWMGPLDREDLERLLERKLKKHGGNVKSGLAEVASPAVRQALSSVADADVQSSLAELPEGPEPDGESTTAYVPETRGRYTLTNLHATGGIGRVWLARDTHIGRNVALKDLQPERAGNAAARSRFVAEAQVTGQLEHPGIVPVYELARGPGGQPFYTMRFIQGRTLTEAARSFHARRAEGRAGPLEQNGLLTAFVAVCHAVAYAHARGVVHRDLKGHNVVLGDFGEVIVLDWGLAKVVGRAETATGPAPVSLPEGESPDVTAEGQVVGTPAYMSPEQSTGRPKLVDQRSDVYGLGAILYDILTGRPPFQGGSKKEVLRLVREEAPTRPRQVCPTAPAALEAVCLRALAKDPADRYPSAKELAEEVQRWLADEPVRAYREPSTARLGRWARRHRPLVAAAAALLVTAVVALGVSTVMIQREQAETEAARDLAEKKAAEERLQRDAAQKQFRRAETNARIATRQRNVARKQRRRAEANAGEAARQKKAAETEFRRAERNFRKARKAVNQMLLEVGARELAGVPQMEKLRARLLERALGFYQDFLKERSTDPKIQAGTIAAYLQLARIQKQLARHKEAKATYDQVFKLLLRLTKNFTTRKDLWYYHIPLYADYPAFLSDLGLVNQALVFYRASVNTHKKLVARFPQADLWRQGLIKAYLALGNAQGKLGKNEEAEKLFRLALGHARMLNSGPIFVSANRDHLAACLMAFAGTVSPKRAEGYYRQGLAIYQTLVFLTPGKTSYQGQLARAWVSLGWLLFKFDHLMEAEQAFKEALLLQEDLVRNFPATPSYRLNSCMTWKALGTTLGRMERRTEAEQALRKAIAMLDQLVVDVAKNPDYHGNLVIAYTTLADLLGDEKRIKEAEIIYGKALSVCQGLVTHYPHIPDYRLLQAGVYSNLAQILTDNGRAAEAVKPFRKAIFLLKGLVRQVPRSALYQKDLSHSYQCLAWCLIRLNQRQEAAGPLRRSLQLLQDLVKRFPEVPRYRHGLIGGQATEYLRQGNHAQAALKAAEMARSWPRNPYYLFDAFGISTLCIPEALRDPKLSEIQRKAVVQRYGDQAMTFLKMAIKHGFRSINSLKKDADSAPLRSRADFKKLLADLEEKVKKSKEKNLPSPDHPE
jgi:tetratricopeptide (TPR) repeat protein